MARPRRRQLRIGSLVGCHSKYWCTLVPRLGLILSNIFTDDTDDGADSVLCKFTGDMKLGGVAAIQRDRLGEWIDSKWTSMT